MELLTAAQMRAIEQAAIASGAVTGLELMERAGRGVVEAIWEEWPELKAVLGRAVVLCGPGNNGGDGFVVARLLKEWGWEVEVFLYGDASKLPPDARVNYERWGEMGEVAALANDTEIYGRNANVIVDAIFGTGIARPFLQLPSVQVALNDAAHFSGNESGLPSIVAIDVPSGIDGTSGRMLSEDKIDERNAFSFAARANLTVTFHAQKIGHQLAAGPETCGSVKVVDIGLDRRNAQRVLGSIPDHNRGTKRNPAAVVTGVEFDHYTPEFMGSRSILDKDQGHKFEHGHALLLSGGVAKGGAARLAARGALRIGAGVVTVGCPPSALMENAQALDAVMVRRVEDGSALAAMLEEDARINALCLGPGMGAGEREAGLIAAALDGMKSHPAGGGGVVLDADALTILAGDAALFAKLHQGCVLTPHAGEFARMFPDIAEKLAAPATKGPAYSKVDATREAAKRAGCVVLFKGPDTVIADPKGRCSINSAAYERAAPWLATAGSGDVLAGFITGLLARRFAPMQAAETAAWLHVECARSFGPGLIAEDLPEELPKVFRALGM